MKTSFLLEIFLSLNQLVKINNLKNITSYSRKTLINKTLEIHVERQEHLKVEENLLYFN